MDREAIKMVRERKIEIFFLPAAPRAGGAQCKPAAPSWLQFTKEGHCGHVESHRTSCKRKLNYFGNYLPTTARKTTPGFLWNSFQLLGDLKQQQSPSSHVPRCAAGSVPGDSEECAIKSVGFFGNNLCNSLFLRAAISLLP